MLKRNTIDAMDVIAYLRSLPDKSVHCVITSPPYFGLRDYQTTEQWIGGDPACDHKHGRFTRSGMTAKQATMKGSAGDEASRVCKKCGAQRVDQQIGLEETPSAYIERLVDVFREVWRVLRDDGVAWLNLGDGFAPSGGGAHKDWHANDGISKSRKKGTRSNHQYDGFSDLSIKRKDQMLMPARVAIALVEDGWYLRSEIVWSKNSVQPESVQDRPTKSHEYVFLLAKSASNLLWVNDEGYATNRKPKPDYVYTHQLTGERVKNAPPHWNERALAISIQRWHVIERPYALDAKRWRRVPMQTLWKRRNQWSGRHYWIDMFAIREHSSSESHGGGALHPERKYQQLRPGENKGLATAEVTKTRNKRSVWTLPSGTGKGFKGEHYAAFPDELIEPMVLAGCPAFTCAQCGSPYLRVVEREHVETSPVEIEGKYKNMDRHFSSRRLSTHLNKYRSVGRDHDNPFPQQFDRGFVPSCDCNAGVAPGVVLDPFMGSGTTALVAIKHGRDYVGCDLNPEYVAMAMARIRDYDPLQSSDMGDGLIQHSLWE